MSKELFDEFPRLISDEITIRKMELTDVEALEEICSNEAIFQYAPQFLYKNSKKLLETAIKNLGGRDFEKKRCIIGGIYLTTDPDRLVGMAEMFDYDKNLNMLTIGYKINEAYWNQGIATKAVSLMVHYLLKEVGVNRLQAFVMPENVASTKVLLKNGFTKEGVLRQANIWKGQGIVDLQVFSILQSDMQEA
ncbi:GNAT family N-acetyltransferase [Anaerosporobacter faecicola]|uniref:GNAT family N-acetyltransferase n=1 Tax=Anaerosporobacter faecicola TaxID=2718714 RepID=UPI00143B3A62|nr:GNAT family protein [Anaerosporobacter faecicola]